MRGLKLLSGVMGGIAMITMGIAVIVSASQPEDDSPVDSHGENSAGRSDQ